MLPRKTPRRKCAKYEREWNGFCVDRNVEDNWLLRLNSLKSFNLISICEGHCNRRAEPTKRIPHIKLRLKDYLIPGVAAHWDQHKMAILGEVNGLFQNGDTYVNMELKFKLRLGTGRLTYQEDLVVRIHSRRPRTSDDMDAATRCWFQENTSYIEELDGYITRIWDQDDVASDGHGQEDGDSPAIEAGPDQ
jgi:hypothetical protein